MLFPSKLIKINFRGIIMDVSKFFKTIFGEYLKQEKGLVELRVFEKYRGFYKSVEEVVANLSNYTENGYFGVCLRKAEIGTKEGVSYVVTLWADVDFGTAGHKAKPKFDTREEAFSAIEQFEPKPSIVVFTGHGFQLYWLLSQPVQIQDEVNGLGVERILKGLANAVGADSSVAEIARVMRIPNTINQKLDDNRKELEPKNVEIIIFEPDLRYTFESFKDFKYEAELEEVDRKNIVFAETSERINVDSLRISDKFKNLIKNGDTANLYRSRSECDQAVICTLLQKNYNFDQIKSVFSDNTYRIGEKYREKRYCGKAYLQCSIKNAVNFIKSHHKGNSLSCEPALTFPQESFPTTGFLGEYVRYARPVTDAPLQFLIASAIAVVSTCLERKVYFIRGDVELYANFWIVVLAPSGYARKSSSQTRAMDLLAEAYPNLRGPHEFSHEALIAEMQDSPSKILSYNEISTLLSQAEADYNRGLKSLLVELYDCPQVYRRKLKNQEFVITKPYLNILGASTFEWFVGKIKEDELKSGFLARFIYFTAGKKEESLPLPDPADKKLRKKLVKMLIQIGKKRGNIKLSPEAKEDYEKWYIEHENRLDDQALKAILASFYVRLCDYALRLAMIFAVNDETLLISKEHMAMAISFINYLRATLEYLLNNEMVFSPFAKGKKKIRELIVNSGPGGITRGKLLQNSNEESQNLDKYIRTLAETDEIYEDFGPKGGKIYISAMYKKGGGIVSK
jgi:hypothetical protein